MRTLPRLRRHPDLRCTAGVWLVDDSTLQLVNLRVAIGWRGPRSDQGWMVAAQSDDLVVHKRTLDVLVRTGVLWQRFPTRREALRVAVTLIATEPELRA